MPGEFRPILRNEAGLTILATGVLKIRESKAILDKVIDGEPIDDPARERRALVVLHHELIHFFQSFTTGYLFEYCEKVRRLTVDTVTWLRDPDRDQAGLDHIRTELTKLDDALRLPAGQAPDETEGVSVLQLMEAAAVVESLKALDPAVTLSAIYREVESSTGAQNSTYTRALKITEKVVGSEATVRLLPTLAFLALNTSEPGAVFCDFLDTLTEVEPARIAELHPFDVLNNNLPDKRKTIIAAFAQRQRPSKSPFFNDVGLQFAASADNNPDILHFAAANPHVLFGPFRSGGPDVAVVTRLRGLDLDAIASQCFPPLTMYEDGTGTLGGLAGDWPHDQIEALFATNALIGAMYRLALKRDYDIFCEHRDCPDRKPGALPHGEPTSAATRGHLGRVWIQEPIQGLHGTVPSRFRQDVSRRMM